MPSRSCSVRHQSTSAAVRPGDRGEPADPVGLLDHRHTVAADRRDPGRLEAGGSGADHDDVARVRRRHVPVGILGLAAARRLADAGDDRVAGVAHLAGLVAASARADPVGLAGGHLGDEIGVGDLGSGHLDGVAQRLVVVAAERPLGLADVDDGTLQDHGNVGMDLVDRCADVAAHLDVEPGRFVEVGPGLLDGVDRTAGHHQVVESGIDERHGDLRGHLGRDPRPGSEFVARQTQADDPVAGGATRGLDHLAGQAQTIVAPLVVAMVREPGQELADQAVLAGVDLDAVEVGIDGQLGGRAETVDDGGDVVGLHPLGNLAGVHLGDPRRRPQRRLAVGRRSLPAGVIERRDHERPVRVAGAGDRRPAVGAPFGQQRALVGPVRRVHRGALDDDRAATAGGPAFVVRREPFGDRPVVGTEIGDVRPEHDPVRCGTGTEGEGRQQLHVVSILAGTINSC